MSDDKAFIEPVASSSDRVIGEFIGDPAGPTLIVFGGVHGNEAAGAIALERVAAKIDEDSLPINGRVYFFRGNTRALASGVRFVDNDLNRHFTEANVVRNSPGSPLDPLFFEDLEQREIIIAVRDILESAFDEVFVIDLHSTSSESSPFATVGDTLRNRAFAQRLPVTILLGIEEQLDGTMLEYINHLGAVTMGFEGGQHYADSTVDMHEALIWLAMIAARIIPHTSVRNADEFARIVRQATGRQRIIEVRYRHAIGPEDGFVMKPGFENFDPIKKGTSLASDKTGEIRAKESGMVIMPLYQRLGDDGFFVGREVVKFWLRLSRVLRSLRLGDNVGLLPGVTRQKDSQNTFEVNTKVARFFPLQVFHLLGFRKLRWTKDKLVVSNRKFDLKSPFKKRAAEFGRETKR